MTRLVIIFLFAFMACQPVVYGADDEPVAENQDLFLRSAFYRANQQDWFEAIAQIDYELIQHFELDEPSLDSLYGHIDEAQYAFGDFELSYGLYQQADRALTGLIENARNPAQLNSALYRLAKLHYMKGKFTDAEKCLAKINSAEPGLNSQVIMLNGQVAMALGHYEDAVNYLEAFDQSSPEFQGLPSYNLGIALLGSGQLDEGIKYLSLTSHLDRVDPVLQVVKDKANQVLGEQALNSGQYLQAKNYFLQVRLDSPYANRALLGAGWASVNLKDYAAALIPWTRLADQQRMDQSVQEVLLALPYAYAKLGVFSTAANKYSLALGAYDQQVKSLESSIDSIKNGYFLNLLERPEIAQDKDWLVHLRDWPEAPETYYLVELMAEHSFHTALQNYIDLIALRRKLETWQLDVAALKELIALRKNYYESVLEGADRQISELDSRLNLHLVQRQAIEQSLQKLLVVPDYRLLATATERIAQEQLTVIRTQLKNDDSKTDLARVKRLEGVLSFAQKIEFPDRLSQALIDLQELNSLLVQVQQQYDGYLRIRQAATLSYRHYDHLLAQLTAEISEQLKRTKQVILLQGEQLETMTIAVLEQRLERIRQFQTRARFAMADSYDRAAREQAQE